MCSGGGGGGSAYLHVSRFDADPHRVEPRHEWRVGDAVGAVAVVHHRRLHRAEGKQSKIAHHSCGCSIAIISIHIHTSACKARGKMSKEFAFDWHFLHAKKEKE